MSVTVGVGVQPGSLGTATVDPGKPGIQIPAEFMGLSHEWMELSTIMGEPGNTNPIYRQLLKNLLAYGSGPILIRIGGSSTDSLGTPTATTVAPMSQLATDMNGSAKFTLGVNLGQDNVELAAAQAQDFVNNMPAGSLQAIEIGNEPDLYATKGQRPPTYTFANYFSDFATWRTRIMPLLPSGLKLMGPSWANTGVLVPNIPTFLQQEQPYLAMVSQHNYAGSQCRGKTNPPDYLLFPTSTTRTPHTIAPGVALVHQARLPFRMGEMNSISCGGETGVSDIFASALWAIDMLFELANIGVDGVNFHMINGGAYGWFNFSTSKTGTTMTFAAQSIRPEYYGVLLFQQATGNGSKLLPVALTTQANVKAWATVDNNGTIRVILINKDENAEGVVNVSLPGHGTGAVTRLLASSYQATTGITLGGQTFDGTPDGKLLGNASSEEVAPTSGVYSVALGKTSAAVLTIQP